MPNIFRFAPKELSQDALLCYLVACASARDASDALRQCGRAFVQFLFRAGAPNDASSVPVIAPADRSAATTHSGRMEVGTVNEPRRQHHKIDVSFQAEIDGKMVTFLIEDKTGSGKHGNQLKRYLDAVSTDDEHEDFVKPIYLKTGYIFSDERESVEGDLYSIVAADDLLGFLESQDAGRNDEVLRQYAENLRRIVTDRTEALQSWKMGHAHVQWEFMLRLQKLVPAERPQRGQWQWNGVKKGTSSGNPWTQYVFLFFEGDRGLFWRIDAGKPLRLMRLGGDPGRVRKTHQPDFRRLADEIGDLQQRDFRSKSGHEMTIGAIAFPEDPGRMDDFVERVARLHRGFLQQFVEDSD